MTRPPPGKDRSFVTALARGLEVLRCFRPGETTLSNQDFAARTGLPKPTVSRLTYTLCQLDYLVADPQNGTYRLGAGVLNLGFGVLSGLDILARAANEMRDLQKGPNAYITCALGQRHKGDVVYVAVERSREDVALTMHVGARLPLFFSAIGRAILVGLPIPKQQNILERAIKIAPDMAVAFKSSLARAMAEFDARGYCTGYGDWRADVNGIAAPVLPLNGGRIFALNVGGPSFHVKKSQLEGNYAPRLLKAAQNLGLQAR